MPTDDVNPADPSSTATSTERVSTERVSTERVSTERVSTERVSTETADGTGSSAPPSAEDVVADLDLRTKVKLLGGNGFWALHSVPQAEIAGIVVADGPHGLRCQVDNADHLGLAAAQPATCFPTAAALGSSWDVDLLDEVGRAIGEEALALGVSVVLGPGVNLKRHPAGGRSFEYLSEDPLLGGRLAAGWIRGVQSKGVGASLKHYAVNNQESHRLVVDAVVDERTLRELYLRSEEVMMGGLASGRDSRIQGAQQALRQELAAAQWPPEDVEAHMARAYPNYWTGFDTATHLRHARMVREAERSHAPLTVESRVDVKRSVT